jgi:hypothetical protein
MTGPLSAPGQGTERPGDMTAMQQIAFPTGLGTGSVPTDLFH